MEGKFKGHEAYGVRPRHRRRMGLGDGSDVKAKLSTLGRTFAPPEKMIPFGFHDSSATFVVHGSSSAKTPRARSRRRIR